MAVHTFLGLKSYGYPDIDPVKAWDMVQDIWCACPDIPFDILSLLSKVFVFQHILVNKVA